MRRSSSVSRLPISQRESMIRPRTLSLDKRVSSSPSRQNPTSSRTIQGRASSSCRTPVRASRLTVQDRGRASSSSRTPSLWPPSQDRGRSSSKSPGSCYSSAAKSRIEHSINKKKQSYEQAYIKFVEYIKMNPAKFDAKIVNETTIKPPSLITFIYIINVLLQEINSPLKISLTPQNYKEILPNELKSLKYPETVTQGTFRLVNSMHAFPQVISMFAWLIKLINTAKDCGEPMMHAVVLKYFFTLLYTQDWGNITEINDTFRPEIDQAIGLDIETFEKEKYYLNKYEQELQVISNKLSANEEEVESIKQEMAQKLEYNKNFKSKDQQIIDDLEYQLVECRKNKQILEQKLVEERKNRVMLKETIETQPCSKKQSKLLKQKIEQARKLIHFKKENIDELQKVNDDFDLNMRNQINKIEQWVHQWNTSLIKIIISKPETKVLLLREKGFNDDSFIEDIQTITEKSRKLQTMFNSYIVEVRKKIELELIAKENIILKISEETNAKNALLAKISELKENILVKESEARLCIERIQSEMTSLIEKIKLLSFNKKLLKLDEYCKDLKERNMQCLSELNLYGQNMVVDLVAFQKQVVATIKECDRVKINTMKSFNIATAKLMERAQKNAKLLNDIKEYSI
ncbi:unnamed protein product [Brassicogethes aeneus]|uniref:Kinetochore protein NDC80 n=1 Tax=Brassicogethes aeneus TaxID=1431903 RepID=A0A9P0B3M3_BRAAE|nr:unnamed protein product [Brassicogethes aeneus]